MFLLIGLICFIASCLATISGFGTSTIMIPLLIFFLPYYSTLFIVGFVHWFNSLYKIILFRSGVSWRLIFLFGTPALVMSIIGALFVGKLGHMLLPIVGIFLIVYSLFLLFRSTFYIPATNAMLLLGGTISGFSAGFFGIRGALRSVFLSAFNLPKKEYLATTGVIALLVDTARLFTYWQQDILLDADLYWMLPFLVVIAFIGAYIGRIIVQYISQEYFRMVIALFLLLMGVRLVLPLLF